MHRKSKSIGYLLSAAVLVAVLVIGLNQSSPDPVPESPGSAAAEPAPRVPAQDFQPQREAEEIAAEVPGPSEAEQPAAALPHTLEIIVAEKLPLDEHRHTLGTWLGAFTPHPRQWEALGVSEGQPLSFALQTPDGVEHELTFGRFNRINAHKGIYSGTVKGRAFSEAMISFVGEAIVGSLRFPDQGIAWEIRNQGSGVQEYEKVDLAKLPGCAACRHE